MADVIDLTSDEGQDSLDNTDILNSLVKDVDDYLDTTEDPRQLSHKCRDYYDNKQWSNEEIAEHRRRKQPTQTNNKIKPKVQFLMGMETQSRTDPKGLPRTPFDETVGEVSTDALRFVHDSQDADQKFTDGFRAMIIESVEAHDVSIVFKNGKFEVLHEQLSFDRIFWDPHSRKRDFSDAKYLGLVEWMDFDDVLGIPGATKEAITFDDGDKHNTFDDKPSWYLDKKTKRVRVFFINKLVDGVWNWSVFTKGQVIQPLQPSPYLDENGEPEHNFIFQCAFVDRENNRYSEVVSYLDSQDAINYRESRSLHLINQRQTYGNQGAIADLKKAKKQLSKADGHLEIQNGEFGKDFGILPTNDMAQGNLNMLQVAKDDIDGQGANATMTGKDGRDISGVAFGKLQKGGIVEVGTLFDNHRYCKLRVWRAYLNRIKQYWTEERWVRVTDNEQAPKFIGVNREVTFRDKLEEQGFPIPPEMETDPRLDQVVEISNPVGELDVDLTIEETDDIGSIMGEQFDILVRLYEANPAAVPFSLVVQASSFRNKKQLIEMIEGGTPEQQEALQQVNQQKAEENEMLIKAGAAALIRKDDASANKANADAEQTRAETVKTEAEVEETEANTEKIDAQTDQIEIQNATAIEEGIRQMPIA